MKKDAAGKEKASLRYGLTIWDGWHMIGETEENAIKKASMNRGEMIYV